MAIKLVRIEIVSCTNRNIKLLDYCSYINAHKYILLDLSS